MNRGGGTQDLRDSETILCNTVLVDACLYVFVQTQNV